LPSLFKVNVVEVVAEEHGVLLRITHAKVQELLGCTSEVWHILKQRGVIQEWN
jgi:hypothetical protein